MSSHLFFLGFNKNNFPLSWMFPTYFKPRRRYRSIWRSSILHFQYHVPPSHFHSAHVIVPEIEISECYVAVVKCSTGSKQQIILIYDRFVRTVFLPHYSNLGRQLSNSRPSLSSFEAWTTSGEHVQCMSQLKIPIQLIPYIDSFSPLASPMHNSETLDH